MYRSFDVETTGFDYYGDDTIFAFCIGNMKGKVKNYRLDGKWGYDAGEAEKILQNFWFDTSIEKIMHNAKFDYSFVCEHLKKLGKRIPPITKIHDTMMMSRLLRNLAPSHALDYLAWELGEYDRSLDAVIKKQGNALGGYQNIPGHLMDVYQKRDGERTALLFQTFYPHIKKDVKLYKDYLVEMELIKTTQRMEKHGILVDKNNCTKLIKWLMRELDDIQAEIKKMTGEFINLNSDASVARILYRKLQMPILKYTPTNQPATDKNTLSRLRETNPHPIHDLIEKQRSYTKGIAMIESYLKFSRHTGYIHPNINTNKARTGRESSENPNLQNVSKNAALLNKFPVPARRAFRAPPGSVLYLVDYSGIELRLIIDQCGDLELIDMINEGIDIHDLFCQYWFSDNVYKNLKDLKRKDVLRGGGKNANFGLAYGASPFKLSSTLGLNLAETLEGYKRICDRFPKIAFFTKNLMDVIREQGYVLTPFGRRLYVPKDKIYAGSNYLIQGTAAGVLKRAQIKVDKYCRIVLKDNVHIVIPVHDELILEYKRKLFNKRHVILPKISRLMTNIPEIKVKLDVEWKVTYTNWSSAKKVDINEY